RARDLVHRRRRSRGLRSRGRVLPPERSARSGRRDARGAAPRVHPHLPRRRRGRARALLLRRGLHGVDRDGADRRRVRDRALARGARARGGRRLELGHRLGRAARTARRRVALRSDRDDGRGRRPEARARSLSPRARAPPGGFVPRAPRRRRARRRAGRGRSRHALRADAAHRRVRRLDVIGLDRRRLLGWTVLVSALAILGYASRAAGGKPPTDAAYRYSTAIGGIVQYGIILAIVLAIARPEWRRLLALRAPASYGRALTSALAAFVVVYAVAGIVSTYSHPDREQGLTPDTWDPHRVVPVVEELTFRGLGYSLLAPLGRLPAVLWIGVAFGLAHGLVDALPILIAFGAALAWIRARTESVYPGMLVHGLFNAIALIV